ncbi:hypothetical protein F442_15889, partial [Phytophthora nicotianae P10297]
MLKIRHCLVDLEEDEVIVAAVVQIVAGRVVVVDAVKEGFLAMVDAILNNERQDVVVVDKAVPGKRTNAVLA